MENQIGTIKWIGKNTKTLYEAGLAGAMVLLAEDEREIASLKITTNRFEGHVYELILNGGPRTFQGHYQKIDQESKKVVGREELSAFLRKGSTDRGFSWESRPGLKTAGNAIGWPNWKA